MCRFAIFIVSIIILSLSTKVHAETATVNVEHAFLRETPKSNGAAIGAVNMGDKIEVLQNSKKWVKVRLADGRTGYLWHKLIIPLKVNNAEKNAGTASKVEPKNEKPAAGGQKTIPQDLVKTTHPAAKQVPIPTPIATNVKLPAAAPTIQKMSPTPAVKEMVPGKTTPAQTPVTIVVKSSPAVPMLPAPATAFKVDALGQTIPPPVATTGQSSAAALVLPVPAPENKAMESGNTVSAPMPAVATVTTASPEEATAGHTDDLQAVEEIAKRDEELLKLRQKISILIQERDALRAQLRQYKLAEAADKNSEKVYLRGVGEIDMIAGGGVTTFKVPLSIESKADQVFAATRPDKLVRDGFAYYSAPSTAFKW
jgi:uncharacterized protein YgiM (DUF1202 family)